MENFEADFEADIENFISCLIRKIRDEKDFPTPYNNLEIIPLEQEIRENLYKQVRDAKF